MHDIIWLCHNNTTIRLAFSCLGMWCKGAWSRQLLESQNKSQKASFLLSQEFKQSFFHSRALKRGVKLNHGHDKFLILNSKNHEQYWMTILIQIRFQVDNQVDDQVEDCNFDLILIYFWLKSIIFDLFLNKRLIKVD